MEPSDQENVASVNDTHRAIRQAKPQRAMFVESVEQAIAERGGERGAERMRRCEPARADRPQPLRAPAREPAREAFGERFDERRRRRRAAEQGQEAGGRTVEPLGPGGEIDAETDHHRIVGALEQDARKLGAADEQVVGPFDLDGLAGRVGRDDLLQRDRGDQSERRRRRIAIAQPDQGAGVEIARGRLPFPALPPAPAGLAVGAQPEPLACAFAGKRQDIVIGRIRLGDGADQNKALAALSVTRSSSGIRK